MAFQIKAKVIKNIEVAPKYCKILLQCPSIAKIAQPGQFLQIKACDNTEPLLRRPFSIHRIIHFLKSGLAKRKTYQSRIIKDYGLIEILYEVRGKATTLLAGKNPGTDLYVLGPLGNGFDYRFSDTRHRWSVLVGGGIGIAPLLFLAERLAEHNLKPITVLIGANTRKQILCEKELRDLGCEVKVSTDDGSKGYKGKVTDLLKDLLQVTSSKLQVTVYACGPRPMLREIALISKKYKIPAQVSLEEHMACGFGACLGCAVTTKEGYKRVCKEGPVFDAQDVIW
ncbi:MAG: dihydroorotate dehydrogenase electron transfer subunit [Candidatus Omnitrophica bacterium]|nr:dihydroorotate dehydrogenase electron transfer subunit [Candidatus Omnitrophota bacterium]